MAHLNQALVLGDGDGRFLAALLRQNPTFSVDAVDVSAIMLEVLRNRCQRTVPHIGSRLQTHQTDALSYLAAPLPKKYDFVATHFFLDCLTQPEVDILVAAVASQLAPKAIWIVSDFRIPSGRMHFPAKFLILSLYLAFRFLTGLRVNRLPDHASAFIRAGFICMADSHSLFGMLTTELWTLPLPAA